MRKLSINEIHGIQLEMLKFFHEFCQKNQLSYFVSYGTLLGTIRHNGFIPWDDDVDVSMPRGDYERLIKLMANKQGKYCLKSCALHTDYKLPFAKLIDTSTSIDEYPSKDMGLGVYIDVFPLEQLPKSYILQKLIINQNRLLSFLLYLKNRRKVKIRSFRLFVEELIFKPILTLIPYNFFLNSLNRSIKNNKVGDKCSVLVHSTIADKIYSYSGLFPLRFHTFEDTKVNIPQNWDDILKATYGDYMTPPPEKERSLRHNLKAWLK